MTVWEQQAAQCDKPWKRRGGRSNPTAPAGTGDIPASTVVRLGHGEYADPEIFTVSAGRFIVIPVMRRDAQGMGER